MRLSNRILIALCCAIFVGTCGCGSPNSQSPTSTGTSESSTDANSEADSTETTQPASNADPLQTRLDRALDYTFYNRELNTADHGAWQILHGVLAYQEQFRVRIGESDSTQSAIQYLLNGGVVNGWQFRPGQRLENGRIGLRAVMQPGTKRGQGHADQWLAILAQCGYPTEQQIVTGGRTHTIGDLLGQVQLDVSNNELNEFSWTLIGFSNYLEPEATWTANDGEEWSIPKLIEIEIGQDLSESACGGTHRLIGVTMARNEHIKRGGELTGIWADADTHIQTAVRIARQTQNSDGSFSPNYFSRSGQTVDMATRLATTGHILEFLALALSKDDLQAEWVKNAASNLAGLFLDTEEIALECGALYHAAHGLVLYRDVVFGKKDYPPR